MMDFRMARRLAMLLWLPAVLLWSQSDKNTELAGRQAQTDAVRQSNRQTAAARMQAAAETLQSLQTDTERLNKLSQELKEALALNASNVLSEESLKRNDEMEKLVKRIKSTMRKAAGR